MRTQSMWRYNLASAQLEKAGSLPTALYVVPVPFSDIIDGLLVANIYPPELATVSQQTFTRGEPLGSENGRYTALVSQHVYGPQDVLILMSSEN